MLTLPQRRPVVDDAIMVGRVGHVSADRKSRFLIPRRTGVTRIFAWRPCKPPTCHATHSRAFPRCIKFHYSRGSTLLEVRTAEISPPFDE
ncbi:hypothetical protein HZH66_008945 [Vespula vulgaris]|uniref:Uncharacterized protein n=1 Tax=Vespula vulgaris TaxID=7454 RepID=A0A834JRS1_VESVU|nr:hypothetical protein HZH66_008945 [Vespula vulgaris]